MALVLSGSIDISGSMTATTIIVSAPGSSGMVSSSQQIQNYNLFAQTSSANTFYGNQTITGSVRITNGLIIGASGSFATPVSYPNALTVNGNTTGTFGGAIFLARGSATQWGIISNDSDDLSITNNNSFSTRNIKIYDSAEKIEFTYSGSLADNSAGYHNIAFTGNAIVPYQTNHYDLGSETNYFRDLYISTGSIKFIDNGNVVGILSTTADGLNFDSNITIGTSSFEIGRRGTTYKNTNLVMGFDVMNDSIVTGQHNIGMGSEAGASLSSGNYNIMIGYQAGNQIGPGSRNVLIGQGSGNSLLLSSGISPDDNTLVGGNSGQFITKGNKNTALGNASLYGQTGAINTFQNNTAIGYGTATNVSGVSTNNIYIGAYAGPQSSFTTETYKFYVSNGQQSQQPYMFGNMATSSRSLDINASLAVSGSLTVSGSSLFTTKVKIGPDIGNGINTSFANALEIGSNPDISLGGALFLGNTLGSSTWGMVSNGSNNFAIANQSGFDSRAVTLYNTETKIEFLYSGSLNARGAGFHNIRFDQNGIVPGEDYVFDLGTPSINWKNAYIGGTTTTDILYVGNTSTFNSDSGFNKGIALTKGGTPTATAAGQVNVYSAPTTNNIIFQDNASTASFVFNNSSQTYTFPAATGTIPVQTANGLILTGSLRVTGSFKVGDWQHGEGVANTAKLDIRTASDRGLKINGASSSDVIITAYRGASDDMIRSMRLEASDINIYTGDGNANTGSYIGGFNTNGLAFAAGKGIDFSATSNGSGTTSSELLNDYEEGTFTPTYTGTNLTVVTYGNQFGWYTKVGRLVTVTICLMTEDITISGTYDVKIGGLPFTSNSTAQASNALIIADSSRWASNPPIAGVITPNTTEVILYKDLGAVGAGTDPTTVKTSDLADATGNRNVVRATLTYFV